MQKKAYFNFLPIINSNADNLDPTFTYYIVNQYDTNNYVKKGILPPNLSSDTEVYLADNISILVSAASLSNKQSNAIRVNNNIYELLSLDNYVVAFVKVEEIRNDVQLELVPNLEMTQRDLRDTLTLINDDTTTLVSSLSNMNNKIDDTNSLLTEIRDKIGSGGGGGSVDLSNYYDKTETDNLLSQKADNTTVQTIQNNIQTIESNLNNKQDITDNNLKTTQKTVVGAINEVLDLTNNSGGVDLSDYYNKTETDNLLNNKVNNSELNNYYNKTETNDLLTQKADSTRVDTIENTLANKQNITDDTLTTTDKTISGAINEVYQLVTTGGGGVDTSNFVTKDEVKISDSKLLIPLGKDGTLTAYSYVVAIADPRYDVTVNQNTVYINPYYMESTNTSRSIPSQSVFLNTSGSAYNLSTGYNIGIGYGATPGGTYSIAIGNSSSTVTGGVSLGYSATSDSRSVSIGHYAYANGDGNYYKEDNVCIGYDAGRYMQKQTSSGGWYSGKPKQQCVYIGANVKTYYDSGGAITNENVIGANAYGGGQNTFTLGNTYIQKLICQATQITQSCDLKLKENIRTVDTQEVINSLMKIEVIFASYKNYAEFYGSNKNDKSKLMWNANNIAEIPLFAKDVTSADKVVIPLNEKGEYLSTKMVKVTEVQTISTFDEEGKETKKEVEVEVEKEIPVTETIEECKDFTPNQIMQALVVGFQEQQKTINKLKEVIKEMGGNIE